MPASCWYEEWELWVVGSASGRFRDGVVWNNRANPAMIGRFPAPVSSPEGFDRARASRREPRSDALD